MKLEVFKEIIKQIIINDKIVNDLYKIIDLINFTDNYNMVNSLLLKAYYGKSGANCIDYYLYEGDDEFQTIEELWDKCERGRATMKEYTLPTPMTDEERTAILKLMFNPPT